MNYRRKSVAGLSHDFVAANTVGFFCYSVFNLGFLSSKAQEEYWNRFGSEVPVKSNDVWFSTHALVICAITWGQVAYYRDSLPLRPWAKHLIMIVVVSVPISIILLTTTTINLIDVLYCYSFVKMCISVFKYIPQVLHNYKRASTIGWSIENIILDITGGMFSIFQVIIDGIRIGDFSVVIGNPVKFSLGLTSLVFDCVFIIQHFVLYKNYSNENSEESLDESQTLISDSHEAGLILDDELII